ncbi:hypothetical protein KDK95_03640 [Actinospica sp. MGRD01-02]|uniref:DUF4190 domain-containing protein n=1 Tax=Actinospica acidithermotolerans TaxID=2828514 RepID=A0A941IHP6_9ACTN|nr:hypothetical protein [Actinospica acidithermotolerans]MBR7825388.1 hypothetical protein [Actinospica acidithermotolerans]
MSDPHGPELGRPRYRPQAGSGPLLPGQRQPSGGGQGGPERTANVAIVAILIASIGWILPILGGVAAIRRGNAAVRAIEGSGGALDGLGLALWARRLGWIYVVAWSAVLFAYLGGPAIQLFYDLVRHLM